MSLARVAGADSSTGGKYRALLRTNRSLITNAGSLVGATVVTSVLGFAYWGVAARLFSPESVGYASAAISAMTLFATFGMLGLGTFLIGEVARRPEDAVATILAGVVTSAAGGTVLGIAGAVVAPRFVDSLTALASGPWEVMLFGFGAGITSATFVLDQALIGLLRGGLQLWRNAIFAVAKLALLPLAAVGVSGRFGLSILATWVLGTCLSVVVLALTLAVQRITFLRRPRWRVLSELSSDVIGHNCLNAAVQAPRLLLPVLATAIISARANAAFYAAYMLATFLFMIPTHLSTVLYAVDTGDQARLRERTRFTLGTSMAIGLSGAVVLAVFAHPLLMLFGPEYASSATDSLRLLAFVALPTAVKVHYVALCRVRGRMLHGGLVMSVGGGLELAAAAVGAVAGSLTGLSIGLLAASSVVALYVALDLRHVAFPWRSILRLSAATRELVALRESDPAWAVNGARVVDAGLGVDNVSRAQLAPDEQVATAEPPQRAVEDANAREQRADTLHEPSQLAVLGFRSRGAPRPRGDGHQDATRRAADAAYDLRVVDAQAAVAAVELARRLL
jgi:O-antigen/teichoic acid export membrane protein